MKRKNDLEANIRKYNKLHSRGTEIYVPCTYWECQVKSVVFSVILGNTQHGETQYFCVHPALKKRINMTCWEGSNAPDWCPKRKKTGGAF